MDKFTVLSYLPKHNVLLDLAPFYVEHIKVAELHWASPSATLDKRNNSIWFDITK